jgi:hypothetical protein
MGAIKITPVKNRLGQKLGKPGGIKRAEAVDAADKNVETLREEFVASIPAEITALEDLFAVAEMSGLSAELLTAMLHRASQILTLSGTYGYRLLDQVVCRFCDFVSGMAEKDIRESAPVGVHLRAMRLLCPGGPDVSSEESERMLASLAALHDHYGIQRLDEAQAG